MSTGTEVDPKKDTWEVWLIDPAAYEERGEETAIGKRCTYLAPDWYWAKKAYWDEHLAEVAKTSRVSLNAFIKYIRAKNLNDQRMSENRKKPDMSGFVSKAKELVTQEEER